MAMAICSFCGFTALGGAGMNIVAPTHEGLAPYAAANPFVAAYTTCGDMWFSCDACLPPGPRTIRAGLQPVHPIEYTRLVLDCSPQELQLLSVLDVSMHFTEHLNGFARGTLAHSGLMSAPLVTTNRPWPTHPPTLSIVAQHVLLQLIQHNPILSMYMTLVERSCTRAVGLAVMAMDVASQMLGAHVQRGPLAGEHSELHADAMAALVHINPLFHAARTTPYIDLGEAVLLGLGVPMRWQVERNELHYGLRHAGITVESGLFTWAFPYGTGFYTASHGMHFADYLRMRVSALFSLLTMVPSYVLTMYQYKFAMAVLKSTREQVIAGAVAYYMKKHPGATMQDAIAHAIKQHIPPTVPGTPAYFRKKLLDLLTIVDTHGMPHFFLTLTCDEVSSTRWVEFDQLDALLARFSRLRNITWQDVPAHCSAVFLHRLDEFMSRFILCNGNVVEPGTCGGLLGRVTRCVVRFEGQQRGSLHAHILLWVHPDDVERVANEIVAFIPAKQAPPHNANPSCTATTGQLCPDAKQCLEYTWYIPDDPREVILLKYVLRKQIHACRAEGCRKQGTCKYCFPQPLQPHKRTVYNPATQHYDYYRPRECDRFVVPYHPTVMLHWGAHCNVQRVTNKAWSQYLLKYALKAEPSGEMNVDTTALENMGLGSAGESMVLCCAAALIHAMPVGMCEAALMLQGRQPVEFTDRVVHVDSKPPAMRAIRCSRRSTTANPVVHPVQVYSGRPFSLQHVTFTTYYKLHTVRKKRMVSLECVGTDLWGNFVHTLPEPALVRFSDYHPAKNIEGFMYNLLLDKVPFRNEMELLSQGDGISYFIECVARGFITNLQDIADHVHAYCARHLYQHDQLQQTLDQLSAALPPKARAILTLLDEDAHRDAWLEAINTLAAQPMCQNTADTTTPSIEDEAWFQQVLDADLTDDQQRAKDKVTNATHGMFVITGGAGTGKTWLTRAIAAHFVQQGHGVVLSATTGAAATRLSSAANTVHSTFSIPVGGTKYISELHPMHPLVARVQDSALVVIDEISMCTAFMLNLVFMRLMACLSCATIADLLQKVVVLLVGDLRQLPPVCRHVRGKPPSNGGPPQPPPFCELCRICNSFAWDHGQLIELTSNVRNASDPAFAALVRDVAAAAPTQQRLDEVLGACYISEADVQRMFTARHMVICTHWEDVISYNDMAMQKLFQSSDIIHVAIRSNAAGNPDMAEWLQPWDTIDDFHELQTVAVGARVMITRNLDLAAGAANGALGTVTAIEWNNKRSKDIKAIRVRLDTHHRTVRVTRSSYTATYHDGHRYWKSTFPLRLAYAITAHSAQGDTRTAPTVLHVRSGFAPGLLYVMLSRVSNRNLLHIVGRLTPDMFTPVPPIRKPMQHQR